MVDAAIIFIAVLLLLAVCFFIYPRPWCTTTIGCTYNSNCSCGANCKCGPGCNCGKEHMSILPVQESCSSGISDDTCRQCEQTFKAIDPNATILPGIGLPSQNNGVCTITHTMGPDAQKLRINGLESSSPLANNALFSTECSAGKTLNLYEMMLPEGVSPIPGDKSNAEKYAEELNKSGINVAGSHWHWWASDPYVDAIHHQNVGMDPVQFACKTATALSNYKQRMGAPMISQ